MRVSAFRGNWVPNKRPYVTLTPDVFVAIQGETSVIGCGECRREININDYVTGISTEASIDSAPGSATINLSVPDTDVNDFYVDGQLVIIPMMEIEIYAKGYFLVGGFPQYYRIFWGVVSSVSKNWSGGTTSVSISCKDILRWWELTTVTINPAFVESFGGSAGGYQLWQNQFAAMNPATIIIKLARESMGDFSLTAGSFTSFQPEKGPEGPVIGLYAKDMMAYWQLKFANIWNSLVIYGSSGQMYSFTGDGETVSPVNLSAEMFAKEQELTDTNLPTSLFKIQPGEITPFKQELSRAGDVEFFQTEQMSKLSIAQACRDQAGWEFYCDTTGDIVFKPPFYNLNVLPNKPISWIQDYEVIDDGTVDSEAEVFTHITSSGNAFGGTIDWGLNDEITTPRTGVVDYHLLRRYGWRRLDYQCEWAGNPKKLFYWLLDYLDRMNAKRQSGSVTIPMRPELKMGFPIWFPKYDSFFYVSGISHQYSVGGQATTTLTLIAKRSKFVAPNNIGTIKKSGKTTKSLVRNPNVAWKQGDKKAPPAWREVEEPTYVIDFPNRLGDTAGLSNEDTMGQPVVVRDPKTGRLLGYPNAVMVYRSTVEGTVLAKIVEEMGSQKSKSPAKQDKGAPSTGPKWSYDYTVKQTFARLRGDERAKTIASLRAHRYEAGMTNGGAYDYAQDVDGRFKEMFLIPTSSISWNTAGETPDKAVATGDEKSKVAAQKKATEDQQKVVDKAKKAVDDYVKFVAGLEKELAALLKKSKQPPEESDAIAAKRATVELAKTSLKSLNDELTKEQALLAATKNNQGSVRSLAKLNVLVRPVSDEFGFEVIGHNKYGRGAFIDRGKIQLDSGIPGQPLNQVNVQFAPTGGLLTDPGVPGANDGASANFASSFERMQPDDYLTGASFTGSNKPDDVKDFQFTSQQTYTNLVNSNLGKSLYVEADALRKAKTLGELKPTVPIGGLDGLSNCSCGLGRANWLGLLPQEIIEQVLNADNASKALVPGTTIPGGSIITGQTASVAEVTHTQNTGVADGAEGELVNEVFPGLGNKFVEVTDVTGVKGKSVDALRGNVSTAGFFDALTKYLQQRNKESYQQNARREARAVASERQVVNTLFDAAEQSNALGDPQSPLFARAASGDPDAIAALRDNTANSNFGMTGSARDNFKKAWIDGKEKLKQTYRTFGDSSSGPVFAVTGGDPNQEKIDAQNATIAAAGGSPEAVSQSQEALSATTHKQVQPDVPTPNLASLILNPTSLAAKNATLVAADVPVSVKTVSLPPTTKPPVKPPGSP